jgi:tetratricopeptide (TPR) repeat protein
MKHMAWSVLLLLAVSPAVFAQEHHSPGASRPAILFTNLGHLHHPIATKSVEAQKFFDQGLTLVYAFNHEEAIRSFQRAAELDPHSPMPWWGVALALGPNINMPMDEAQHKRAYEALQKALALAVDAPENERAYVEALAKRYSSDPKADLMKLQSAYADAMRQLVERYPDDPDASTLYAESLMDLNPWGLWTNDGRPGPQTEEIISVLESVIKRDPNHVGANHYYIHTVEASRHPERALPSAKRLETLVPGAGHLVHMPGHIYMRTGDYAGVVTANLKAVAADRAYLRATGTEGGMYDLMYYSHNLHFLTAGYMAEGRFADAKKTADELVAHITPGVQKMPMAEFFLPTSTFVLLRFHHWDDILKIPAPDARWTTTTGLWHFARGMAFAAKGNLQNAEAERAEVVAIDSKTPPEAEFSGYFNKAHYFLQIAEHMLDARMAAARGDRKAAIEHWKEAVEVEDSLNYGEPPEWYYPVRESLGGELLRDGQAVEAEKVFRADLEKNPRNPRSLFGLLESLKAQNRSADADWVRREFDAAWKNADVTLRVEDL